MSDKHERLKEARIAAGFESAASAAQRFGWAGSTYAGHENGSRGFKDDLAATYARAFRVAPEWILFGKASERPAAGFAEEEPASPDLIPVFNVYASAGHGAAVEFEEVVEKLAFPPDYLRHVTKSHPRNLAIIGVKGDSMLPTLKDDDLVMLDVSKTDLSYDGLFVIKDGGDSLLVKRIMRAGHKDHVMIKSDNASVYPPIERHVSEIEVVGKVVWMGVKV